MPFDIVDVYAYPYGTAVKQGAERVNKILDSLPSGPVIFLGFFFALMPILPEPHLWEKAMMIKDGLDLAPIDWFDIVMHGGAGLLAIAKLLRDRQVAAQGTPNDTEQDPNG